MADRSRVTQFTTTLPPKPAQSLEPQTPPQPLPPENSKRKIIDLNLQNHCCYKIRAIVHDLRSYFIEILRTPDFRNCEAAHEARKRIKLVMDLCSQMGIEGAEQAAAKSTNTNTNPPSEPCSRENLHRGDGDRKSIPESLAAEKVTPPLSSVKRVDDGQILGSYIVGGSVFGWNFITFASGPPTFYGLTKEAHRRCHAKVESVGVPAGSADVSVDKKAVPARNGNEPPSKLNG